MAYLQDHELLDYAVLSEKAAEASAHFNELSARIKAAETRMAEIAVLREHIVNYAKSRDTYVAYRKAGYSKKFLAEHESEITIHKAAKNYFDGLGFKKPVSYTHLNKSQGRRNNRRPCPYKSKSPDAKQHRSFYGSRLFSSNNGEMCIRDRPHRYQGDL